MNAIILATQRRSVMALLSAGLVWAAFGCAPPEKAARGFRLPTGEVEDGRQVFTDMKCFSCHTVRNDDFPAPVADPPVPVAIGGLENTVITDGYLVTAVANPSHRIGRGLIDEILTKGDETRMLEVMSGQQSRMPDYTDLMTVRQLSDLVAYLHTRYEVVQPMAP